MGKIYSKYCNQDLWCAKRKEFCSEITLNEGELTFKRKNVGFFALTKIEKNKICTDNIGYFINFKSGNYLSISDSDMEYVQSKKLLIHKIIELLAKLYIVTKQLNHTYKNKNYTLYEVLVIACKARHYVCINFVSLNKFLDKYRNKILEEIKKLTGLDAVYYNYFPDYIAILYLTRNERREKAYKARMIEDHPNGLIEDIQLQIFRDRNIWIGSHTHFNQINNLIKILTNPRKITFRKLEYSRSKQ